MKLRAKDYTPADWPEFVHRVYDLGDGIGVLAVRREDGKLWELHPIRLPEGKVNFAVESNARRPDYTIHPEVGHVQEAHIESALAKIEAAIQGGTE